MSTKNMFKPGDRALHKSNQLDSREVHSVEGGKIRLLIGDTVTEPVPAAHYWRIPHPATKGRED